MLFTWDTQDLCVVFRWWHVRGPWSLFLTLLGVVALGMSYELLRNVARKFDDSTSSGVRLGTPVSDSGDPDFDNRGRRSPSIINSKYFLPLPLGHLKPFFGRFAGCCAGCGFVVCRGC